MVTSFLYHCCDSIDGPLWLTEVRNVPLAAASPAYISARRIPSAAVVVSNMYTMLNANSQGQWHRLDNIGSVMSFIIWAIHLMDLPNPLHQRYLQYVFLALVLVFQEKNPWDDFNAVVPILLCFSLLFVSFVVRRRIPRYDWTQLARGIFFLGCGVGCFVRGLDDDNDPFRFFHGCWHAFIGASAYCNFRILPRHKKTTHLPVKKY